MSLLGTIALATLSAAAQPAAPLTITSPVSGTTVTSGQSFAITVTVGSGTYPPGIAIFAQDPLGGTDLQPVVGSTATFTLMVPANTSPGSYALTAASADSTGADVESAPISVLVERADLPTALTIYPPATLNLRFIGDTNPITVFGTFTAGLQIDVTHSTHLTITSENPNVATVQNGIITAVGSGQTNIDVQYGSITAKLSVTVPAGTH